MELFRRPRNKLAFLTDDGCREIVFYSMGYGSFQSAEPQTSAACRAHQLSIVSEFELGSLGMNSYETLAYGGQDCLN
jgi:hypothetical protein